MTFSNFRTKENILASYISITQCIHQDNTLATNIAQVQAALTVVKRSLLLAMGLPETISEWLEPIDPRGNDIRQKLLLF